MSHLPSSPRIFRVTAGLNCVTYDQIGHKWTENWKWETKTSRFSHIQAAAYHDIILTVTTLLNADSCDDTNCQLSSITGRGHDIGYSCSPKTWILHLLIYFVRGSQEPMIKNNAQKDYSKEFCVVSNILYQFISLSKVSESNKSWEYGGVKLFYFLAKSFFHQTFWDKIVRIFLLESVPWCIITSLNVWVNSLPAGVDVTYCPDPGAHETLLAWFLHGGEWRVGRKKIVIKWWIFIKTFSVSAITIILHLYFWIFNSLGSHHPQSLPQLVKGVWFLCDTSLPVREFMLEGRDRAMYCVTSGNRW